jgi:hypothetical protein
LSSSSSSGQAIQKRAPLSSGISYNTPHAAGRRPPQADDDSLLTSRVRACTQHVRHYTSGNWSTTIRALFSSQNRGEKHCIRILITFRLYLVKIIQILTN